MTTRKFQRTQAFTRRRSRLETRSLSSFHTVNKSNSSRRTVTRSNSTISVDAATFGECCGGTTAECAAICCCCPLAVADLLVLAVYKVPAGLCRRAIRRQRQRNLLKKGPAVQPCNQGAGGDGCQIHHMDSTEDLLSVVEACEENEEAETVKKELENEMLERFYSLGFGRSCSQREGESPRN